MESLQLKNIRIAMNLDIKSMSTLLGWPYRTYQDRELGNRRIPDKAAAQVLALQSRERETTAAVIAKIRGMIDLQFPAGIQSIQEVEE